MSASDATDSTVRIPRRTPLNYAVGKAIVEGAEGFKNRQLDKFLGDEDSYVNKIKLRNIASEHLRFTEKTGIHRLISINELVNKLVSTISGRKNIDLVFLDEARAAIELASENFCIVSGETRVIREKRGEVLSIWDEAYKDWVRNVRLIVNDPLARRKAPVQQLVGMVVVDMYFGQADA